MAESVERAYHGIRNYIVSGVAADGERLLEEELAAQIGVSRTPIREALRRLALEGFIEFIPNRGARVPVWSEKDLDDLFVVRAHLESLAAGLAASRISDETLERLHQAAETMVGLLREGSSAIGRIAEENNKFHGLIYAASGNRRLQDAASNLVQLLLVHRTFHEYSDEALRRSVEHHRELVAALRSRDPEWAESVMRSHILAARHAMGEIAIATVNAVASDS